MTTDTVGGVWAYALELISALGRGGVQVALATMGAPLDADQRRQVERLHGLEVYESDYKLEWMDDPWRDVLEAGQWLLDLEQLVRPDVVHLNGYAHGALPWQAPRLVVGHSCVLSWWRAVKGEDAPPEWDTYRHQVRRGVQAADAVVAPSIAMLVALDRHYGPLRNARVISNARAGYSFRYAQPYRKEPFVFAAGRLWDEAKNIAALERVARSLSWPVYVAGNQLHPNGSPQQGLSSVHPLGCLDVGEVAAWMKRASIYCLPARYEPFGLSVLEAALCGCALVLGDIPSFRELWDGAAVFVPLDDDEALRAALQGLINDPAQRQALAERARDRATLYPPNRMAASYLEVYQELTASHAQQRAQHTAVRLDSLPQHELVGQP